MVSTYFLQGNINFSMKHLVALLHYQVEKNSCSSSGKVVLVTTFASWLLEMLHKIENTNSRRSLSSCSTSDDFCQLEELVTIWSKRQPALTTVSPWLLETVEVIYWPEVQESHGSLLVHVHRFLQCVPANTTWTDLKHNPHTGVLFHFNVLSDWSIIVTSWIESGRSWYILSSYHLICLHAQGVQGDQRPVLQIKFDIPRISFCYLASLNVILAIQITRTTKLVIN